MPSVTIKAMSQEWNRRQWIVRRPNELPDSAALSDQNRDLERLISVGYVRPTEPTESHPRAAFMLTAKGVEFLGKRGAGLNEA